MGRTSDMSPGEARYWQAAHTRDMYRVQREEAAADEEYFRDLDEMKAAGFKGTHREWKAQEAAEWKKIMGEAMDEGELETLAADVQSALKK
jgi:hypothetical protein